MDYGKLGSTVMVPAPPGFDGVVEAFERYWVDDNGFIGFGTGTPNGALISRLEYEALKNASHQKYLDTRFVNAFDEVVEEKNGL
jgi:hypothetical protein